jgi:hypothetical protein
MTQRACVQLLIRISIEPDNSSLALSIKHRQFVEGVSLNMNQFMLLDLRTYCQYAPFAAVYNRSLYALQPSPPNPEKPL